MTLVVARNYKYGVRILSDSKFSYPDCSGDINGLPIQATPITGGLKSIIMYPRLCVAFAGNVYRAYDVLKNLRSNYGRRPKLDVILNSLYQVHRDKEACDFIVAVAERTSASMHWISRGKVRKNMKNAWVGDYDAYKAYKQCLSEAQDIQIPIEDPNISKIVNADTRMVMAFQEIMLRQQYESINDILIQTQGGPGGFQYIGMMAAVKENPRMSASNKEGWSTMSLAHHASEGGYNYEVLTPIRPDKAAVAVHFIQPGLGILYHPLHSIDTIIYRDISRDEFVKAVENDYKISLKIVGTIGETGSTISF